MRQLLKVAITLTVVITLTVLVAALLLSLGPLLPRLIETLLGGG